MKLVSVITILLICSILPDIRHYPQEDILLTGVIVDSEGNPLPGVNVSIAGMGTGIVTDAEGKFSLSVSPGSKIYISFIGFSTSSFTVEEMTNIKFNIETGIIEFCCTNHDPSHCGKTMDELETLATEHNCTFK